MSDAARQLISRSEYLQFERDGQIRHEWVSGQVYAMTGGSGRHSRIALRLGAELLGPGDAHDCRVYVSDMKVVGDTFGYYPDVMVACEGDAPDEYFENLPCLIAEVLSPSTSDRDRREKWSAYQTIPSLRHFLLIRQDDMQIDHWLRSDGGEWLFQQLGPDDIIRITCPPTEISVADLYVGL
jgi:Uma2 family endonuclease